MSSLLSTHPLVLAVACLALGLLGNKIVRGLTSPLSKVPGPWHTRFTNLRLKLAVCTGQRMYYIDQLHRNYGPYVRIAPTEVAVNDAAGFKEIHRIGGDYVKSPWYADMTQQIERPGIFVVQNAKAHAARRKLLARPFSKTFLNDRWHDTVRGMTSLAVEKIREDALRGKADVLKWFTCMAMDVSGRLMYGHSFNNLECGEISNLMRIITRQLQINGVGAELPIIRVVGRVLKYLPFRWVQDTFGSNEYLYAHGRTLVNSIRANDSNSSIFANAAAEAEKGESIDDEDIGVEAAGLLIAGTDTTAISLTYLVWAVLSRPELQRDLESEVAVLNVGFTDADLEELPLLGAVISESLRLYGAAPGGLPRMVPHGGAEVGGHYLPQGTTVQTQAYSLHRDPELWPQADEFLPSRWLNNAVSPAAKKVYNPMGAGARSCLGIHLAYMELRLCAAEFFRRCKGARLCASATDESMKMENFFLIAPQGHKCEITLSEEI